MASATSLAVESRISAYLAVLPILRYYTDLVGKDDAVYEVVADAIHAVRHEHDPSDKLAAAFHCFSERRDVLQRVVHATGTGTPSMNPARTPLERALLACDAGLCASFNESLFSLPVVLIRVDLLRESEDGRGAERDSV